MFFNVLFLKKLKKMNNFHLILKQKCGGRSRMRGINTHDKFQTPRTLRTGVMSRKVSGTNKTKKIVKLKKNMWSVPHEGVNLQKQFQTPRIPITRVMGLRTRRDNTACVHSWRQVLDQSDC